MNKVLWLLSEVWNQHVRIFFVYILVMWIFERRHVIIHLIYLQGDETMKAHLLLEKAFRYSEPPIEPVPENCTYQMKRGYWTDNATGKAMMLGNNPSRPQTKKADIETGEDQKGE